MGRTDDICCGDGSLMLNATPASTATEEPVMHAFIAATVATSHGSPAWLKIAARGAFLLSFLSGATWATMSWLALRGVDTL